MNSVLLFPLILLLQGGVTSERTWYLGLCKESGMGSYGCTVKLPRSPVGVQLTARVEPIGKPQSVPGADLKLRLRNNASHMIQMQGLDTGDANLKAGEEVEIVATRGAGGGFVGSFDTSKGYIPLRLDIFGASAAGNRIPFVANKSAAL